MAAPDQIAAQLLEHLGGADNVAGVEQCIEVAIQRDNGLRSSFVEMCTT